MSDGGSVLVVLLAALLLGLRHATDPDHIAAVTTLVASSRERAAQRAAQLGAWWGLGHALTLIVFGVPIVLFERYLPEPLQRGAETAAAGLIVFLAVRLLIRWRSGYFHAHAHAHPPHGHEHRHPVRSPLGAFGIGLAARPRRVRRRRADARRDEPRVRRLVRAGGVGARAVSVLDLPRSVDRAGRRWAGLVRLKKCAPDDRRLGAGGRNRLDVCRTPD